MGNPKQESENLKPANKASCASVPRRFPVFRFSFPVSGFPFSAFLIVGYISLLLLPACSRQTLEDRAREQAEKVIEQMGDAQSRALGQKVTPDEVKQAQEALTQVHEYMGEVNGKLDAVTVNAVESFQRTHGLKDNGILNEKTQRLLREELAKK